MHYGGNPVVGTVRARAPVAAWLFICAPMSPPFTVSELRAALAKLPRLSLAILPTPLENMPRLSAEMGGANIYVKRDDLTGLALGGNKVRQFEYQVAQAVEEGCDVLVHGAAAQSNHSRVTAAVAAKLGLKCSILPGRGGQDPHATLQGNLLLTHLLGAEVCLPEDGGTAEIISGPLACTRSPSAHSTRVAQGHPVGCSAGVRSSARPATTLSA